MHVCVNDTEYTCAIITITRRAFTVLLVDESEKVKSVTLVVVRMQDLLHHLHVPLLARLHKLTHRDSSVRSDAATPAGSDPVPGIHES